MKFKLFTKIKYWLKSIWFLLFGLFHFVLCQVNGQVFENFIPLSAQFDLPAISQFEELPSIDSAFLVDLVKNEQTDSVFNRFAYPLNCNYGPENSGEWFETPGGKVWRLGINSPQAWSLYIRSNYKLMPGARIFIYAPGYKDMAGAYTSKNNNSSEILSMAPVRGNCIIIELNLPASQENFGKFQLTHIYHDYMNIFNNPENSILKSGGSCFEDINCSNGKYWQTEKRSVCKIITNGSMGTGTLIGNTSKNNTPYLLTANHLIFNADLAAGAVFVFNYESSGCNGSPVNSIQALSGAGFVSAINNKLDFALLKLNDVPPLSFMPYYAGWDNRNQTYKKGICIHHPLGTTKQIAIEYHPIVSEDIGKGFDANSTWKVSHWELGTTEPGSSGAPLFNEKHRLIGTLTGGRSTCGYPFDDYFTKFGVAWNSYPDSTNQLKYWLDPNQKGENFFDGYDPYGYNTQFCDTVWNFFENDKLELSNKNLSWGYISGHNQAGVGLFAERFEPQGQIQLPGMFLHVAKAIGSKPLSFIEVKIWKGKQYPETEYYSQLIFYDQLIQEKANFIAFDSVLKISETVFIGYTINYDTDLDTFATYHAADRGWSNPSTAYVFNDSWVRSDDDASFGISTSFGIGVLACYGIFNKPSAEVLNVFPNPCVNSVSINIPGGLSVQSITCFDLQGRQMPVTFEQAEDRNNLYFNLNPGIYFLKIRTSEKNYTARFVVL